MDNADAFAGFLVILLIIGIYLIPTIIAICRKAYHAAAAIVVNVFLGWTFIGWVVALVLALLNKPGGTPQQIVINQVVGNKNKVSKDKETKAK